MSAQLSRRFVQAPGLIRSTEEAQGGHVHFLTAIATGLKRRWLRERRRRKVGRAYDMALEIARIIPRGAHILDVGCGNGFIAHHLSAILSTSVVGIDLTKSCEASIEYRCYDGTEFPAPNDSFDAIVSAYVLHHAQDIRVIISEMCRVLRDGGLAVVYEDIPQTFWDRAICWIHNRQWRDRTGPCAFRNEREWRQLFESHYFEILDERALSRGRNLTHPVARRTYVLRFSPDKGISRRKSSAYQALHLATCSRTTALEL